jgi:AbrB family looped-hinge helix DNA binding protein
MQKSRVGSKGELFPPKEIREKLGLKAYTTVIYKVEDGRLIVEPVPSIEEILKDPTFVEVNLEEFHKFRKELSQKAET